jgi:hypothetical protein
VDIEVILDAAESEAPGLQELAREFLEAEARHFGGDDGAVMALARIGAQAMVTKAEMYGATRAESAGSPPSAERLPLPHQG